MAKRGVKSSSPSRTNGVKGRKQASGRKAPAKARGRKPEGLVAGRDTAALSALVLINEKSGTVRSYGAEQVRDLVRAEISKCFSSTEVVLFDGDIVPHVSKAISQKSHDVIIAGGGDGTICSAAALLVGSDITMGALPLGTMNLFVQALGFSPSWQEAITQFARAKPVQVDVGYANDRIFLHQISFGIQPRMARLREKIGYSSRLTKMFAAARAFLVLMMRPKTVRVLVEADGVRQRVKTPLLIVSNNPLGRSGHAALPERLDSGKLGLYVLDEFTLPRLFLLARDYLADRLHDNPTVDARTVEQVTISHRKFGRSNKAKPGALLSSMDGEVVLLETPVAVTIKPRALKILALPPSTSGPHSS